MNNKKIRILLMGTSSFAVPSFDALLDCEDWCSVVGLITQPDKPVGRDQIMTPPAIAFWAKENSIPLLQPTTLKDSSSFESIKSLAPDLILVAAYGKLIPESILSIPRFGVVNIHPSMLPKYRGPSPIQYAILNGDDSTGISIMVLDKEMDHGPLIYQEKVPLNRTETFEELYGHLAQKTAAFIGSVLKDFVDGTISPIPQNEADATFTKLITTEDGKLDFLTQTAQSLDQKIRALNPSPGTFFIADGKRIKARHGEIIEQSGTPCTFFDEDHTLTVYCLKNALQFEEVQPEGKQWMSSKSFLSGSGQKLISK